MKKKKKQSAKIPQHYKMTCVFGDKIYSCSSEIFIKSQIDGVNVASLQPPSATGADDAQPSLKKGPVVLHKDKLSFHLKRSVSLNTCCANEALMLCLSLTRRSISVRGPSAGLISLSD